MVESESLRRDNQAAGVYYAVCLRRWIEAHPTQRIHRDIKPENCIIHSTIPGMRVKVLDFGIAKLRDDVASHSQSTRSSFEH